MVREFKKGEVIFYEGDMGDTFYEIVDGVVGVYTDYEAPTEKKLTEVESGHIVGELALVDAYPRSATVVCLTDVKTNELTVEDLMDYFDKEPEKVTFMIKEISERISRLTADYNDAVATIGGMFPKDSDRKPGLAEKIKLFAQNYKNAIKTNKISRESLEEIVQTGHEDGFGKNVESYSKGTIIFKEGEPGKCMYDIFTGSVNIYTGYGTPDEKLITTIGVNKFFGEMGLINNSPRTATAVVNADRTTIMSMYMEDFEELYEKNPVKIEMLIKHMAFRVRRLTDQYVDACKLIYEVSEAEASGNVPEELIKEVRDFQSQY